MKHVRELMDAMRAIGCTDIVLGPPVGRGHPKLFYSFQGVRRWRVATYTKPSTADWVLIALTDVRREIGLTQGRRIKGDRRPGRKGKRSRPETEIGKITVGRDHWAPLAKLRERMVGA